MAANLLEQVRAAVDPRADDSPETAFVGTLVSLEASEIYTADVEFSLDRFAHQYILARERGLPIPGLIIENTTVPVDLFEFPMLFDPDAYGYYYWDVLPYWIRSRGKYRTPSLELIPLSPETALTSLGTALREFLAVRFSARESNISQKPGLQFEVETTTPGLRVHYSPAYLVNFNTVFSSPTSPVKQWIQPGRYIFGAVGPNMPLQFDFISHYSIPYDTKARLFI
jgi:hypothetical protein